MPGDKRKPVKIPPDVYERIRRKAEREGRTIGEVLRDLTDQLEEELSRPSQPTVQPCILCGRLTAKGKICDDCFYDPEIVRPQVMGVLFMDFYLRTLENTGNPLNFDDFIAIMDEETAKAHKIHPAEWQEWQEWLEWRRRHKEDPTLRYSTEWKKWVVEHPTRYTRHAGRMLFALKRRGRGGLQPISEILRQTFPHAFKKPPLWQQEAKTDEPKGEGHHDDPSEQRSA
jgi:hypothetical protein